MTTTVTTTTTTIATTTIPRLTGDATARIRAVAPYLAGPVAARLAALTETLEAYLARASDVSVDIARGVVGVCLRMTRDRAPSVAFSARVGLFRLLRAFVEDADGDALETLALKSVVFARVECESWNETAAAHFRELSARFLRCDRRARRATREILRLVADERHQDAARAMTPAETRPVVETPPETPPVVVVVADARDRRRRDDDIERARCRRRALDARRRE